MSELAEIQVAVGKVFEDSWTAYENQEISDEMMVGIKLLLTAFALKQAYREGGLTIARMYLDIQDFDVTTIERQIELRIYDYVQLARMEEADGR